MCVSSWRVTKPVHYTSDIQTGEGSPRHIEYVTMPGQHSLVLRALCDLLSRGGQMTPKPTSSFSCKPGPSAGSTVLCCLTHERTGRSNPESDTI